MFNQLIWMDLKEAGGSEYLSLSCLYVGTSWSQPLNPWSALASLSYVLSGMGKVGGEVREGNRMQRVPLGISIWID